MEYSLEQLIQQKILILDGAMGTMIQKHKLQESDFRGEKFKDHPKLQKGNNDLLTISQPKIIKIPNSTVDTTPGRWSGGR